MPSWLIVVAVIFVSLLLIEPTSNTATAAAFFPIFGAVAIGVGIAPLFLTIAVPLAVCSAYMLPVATPSNAVAFGSGEITIKQMTRAGVWLNLMSIGRSCWSCIPRCPSSLALACSWRTIAPVDERTIDVISSPYGRDLP